MPTTRTQAAPRWAPAVPALQAAVIAAYVVAILDDSGRVPAVALYVLVLGSPFIFGGAWTLGWLVRRRRGQNRADGTEYMTATLGNVLMAFGFVLSVLMWLALVWVSYELRDF